MTKRMIVGAVLASALATAAPHAQDLRITMPTFTDVVPPAHWGTLHYNFSQVEVLDPQTVRIHTKRPEPLFETLISLSTASIIAKEHNDALGFDRAALAPVGTGPYRVSALRAPRLRRNLAPMTSFYGDLSAQVVRQQ